MKKLLTVLCLALLLTLVCTSAMAGTWVTDVRYKSNGKRLADYFERGGDTVGDYYNGHKIKEIVILTYPTCTAPGSARIDTYFTEYDPGTGVYTADTTKAGPSSVVSIDAGHKYTPGVPSDGEGYEEGWKKVDGSDCTHITQKRVCEVCGAAETRTIAVPGNHKFVVSPVPGKEPTCQTKGWAQSVCEVCGAINPANPNPFEMEKSEHVYSIKVTDKAETCDADGEGHYECKWCGKVKPDVNGKPEKITIPKHTFDPKGAVEVIDKAATCFKAGEKHLVCGLCGLPQRDGLGNVVKTAIPALNHEGGYGDWVVVKPASCVDGLEQRVCSLCGNVETHTIPKNDQHTWIEFFKNDGNCTKDATGKAIPSVLQKNWKCAVCNIVYTHKPNADGTESTEVVTESTMTLHQFVSDTSKAASNIPPECVGGKEGIEYLKCAACGGTWERKIPALKEHNFGAWVCVVAPGTDGSENGVWERTCTNYHCIEKQTYVGKTAPDGSKPATDPTTAPTTQPGVTANYKFTSWNFNGSGVSGQVAGNVSYRTPGLSVNVIIYTPQGTFLAVSSPVDENGKFSVSAGGAVYAVSIQLKDNNKTYQTDGKYV